MSSKPRASKLVVLSAPSGTGKSTLASMLLKSHPNFELSVSYTTRKPRGEEKHGQHYFFVSEDEFQSMIQAKQFLEHALVFGKNRYGTARATVEAVLDRGNHVLFDIDVQGANALKKVFGKRCLTIFVLPPSFAELEQRLRNRKTDTPEAIESRLKTAREELRHAPNFDYQVTNSDLQSAFHELENILRKENCI